MYHPGYLDEVGELPLDTVRGGVTPQTSVKRALLRSPADAKSWKALLDRSESPLEQKQFLELLSEVRKQIGRGSISRSPENLIGLNYARLMFVTKQDSRLGEPFAGLSPQGSELQIDSFIVGEKLKDSSFEPYTILLRSQRTPGYRQELKRLASLKPKNYFLRYQYTWSLLDTAVEPAERGRSLRPNTEEHFKELEKLLKDFPGQPTPVYYKMRILHIRKSPEAKIWARKYLELESRSFFPARMKEARELTNK